MIDKNKYEAGFKHALTFISQFLFDYLRHRGERFKRVIIGSATIFVSTLINTFTRMVVVTLVARLYTQEELGIWVIITSTSFILGAFDLGIGNALRNKLSTLPEQGESGDFEAKRYYLSVLYLSVISTILLSIILLVLSRYVPLHALFKTSDQAIQKIGVDILKEVQIIFLLGIPFSIGVNCFFSYQESHLKAIIDIAGMLLSVLFVFILSITKQPIKSVSICYFLAGVFTAIIGTVIFLKKRKWGLIKIRMRLILSYIMKLIPQSFKFGIGQVVWAFILSAPTIAVSAVVGLELASRYNLVQKLYFFVLALHQCIFNPLWAGYADAANHGEWDWCKKILKISMGFTAILFVLIIIFMILFGNFFLTIWVGKKYICQRVLFLFLGVWALTNALIGCASSFLNALGRIEFSVILLIVTAFASISLLSAMGRGFGLNGIAIGSILLMVPSAIAVPIYGFAIIKKNQKFVKESID
jgi:O-antigen/teichoic acid export membrane protein